MHAKAKAEAEEIDAAQKKSKKKDKTKYDPNVRLEVESSKSDQAYEAKVFPFFNLSFNHTFNFALF